jgi:hypothetical protein
VENKRYLSPKEFAQASRLGEKTVRRRLKAGQLPAIQSGGPNTKWSIDWEAYAQQALHVAERSAPSVIQAVQIEDCCNNEKIPGPLPMWKRAESSINNKRGYGSKEKEH